MQAQDRYKTDSAVEEVLAAYEALHAQELNLMASLQSEEMLRWRDEFLLCVGRATGVFLNLLARESGAVSILELGTSAGYSTIWLADAARATDGRVVTIDTVASKQQRAKAALERAGLLDFVDLRVADALDFLAITSETFDFVLLDIWKDLYIPCVDALLPRLRPGATIVADNMIKPAVVRLTAANYQAHLRSIPHLQTVLLPIGSGLAVTRYRVAT
jgi:predicted O-methyltransferase YrrM